MQTSTFQAALLAFRGWPITAAFLVLGVISIPEADAYDTYSTDSTDNCAACHGDFDSGSYISLSDGSPWGNDLHTIHLNMLSGDCDVCHSAGPMMPVFLNFSVGGAGLPAISCVGCHGRNEDSGGDPTSGGLGAGLRQHHFNTGTIICAACHIDADPINYTPVGEHVLPPYYFTPDPLHSNKPTNPCIDEDRVGGPAGLDNDGDRLWDLNDPNCVGPSDTDADGISDDDEINVWGTDPFNADTDNDGLVDGNEELFSLNQTDPLDSDTDDDGLQDGAEDLDKDGEIDIGLESDPVDSDTDDDGLSDGAEAGLHGTDMLNVDTDADGLTDGLELGVEFPLPGGVSDGGPATQIAYAGTDISVFAPDLDTSTHTNPTNADTDGDGELDGIEDANQNGRVDPGETDPFISDEPPPPPEITCLEAANAVIDATQAYQKSNRKVARECGRKTSVECAPELQAQIDLFVFLETQQIIEGQNCQP